MHNLKVGHEEAFCEMGAPTVNIQLKQDVKNKKSALPTMKTISLQDNTRLYTNVIAMAKIKLFNLFTCWKASGRQ